MVFYLKLKHNNDTTTSNVYKTQDDVDVERKIKFNVIHHRVIQKANGRDLNILQNSRNLFIFKQTSNENFCIMTSVSWLRLFCVTQSRLQGNKTNFMSS